MRPRNRYAHTNNYNVSFQQQKCICVVRRTTRLQNFSHISKLKVPAQLCSTSHGQLYDWYYKFEISDSIVAFLKEWISSNMTKMCGIASFLITAAYSDTFINSVVISDYLSISSSNMSILKQFFRFFKTPKMLSFGQFEYISLNFILYLVNMFQN